MNTPRGGFRFIQCLVLALLSLALCVGRALAQSSTTDLSRLVVSADAMGDGWTLSSQGPDSAVTAFSPRPVAAYAAHYDHTPLTATLALYAYADRATALASPGFSDPSVYWGRGNTTFDDLSGYGDGPTYRAYPPGKGATSGITFADSNIVVFVGVDGFDTEDDADALANQLAGAEDALLQAAPEAMGLGQPSSPSSQAVQPPATTLGAPAALPRLATLKTFPGQVLLPPPEMQTFAMLPLADVSTGSSERLGLPSSAYSVTVSAGPGVDSDAAEIAGFKITQQQFQQNGIANRASTLSCNAAASYCTGKLPDSPPGTVDAEAFLGLSARGSPASVVHWLGCCGGENWYVQWYDQQAGVAYMLGFSNGTATVFAPLGAFSSSNRPGASKLATLADQLVRLEDAGR